MCEKVKTWRLNSYSINTARISGKLKEGKGRAAGIKNNLPSLIETSNQVCFVPDALLYSV
jgi:hypothetical protein